jgi:hypothetical protein
MDLLLRLVSSRNTLRSDGFVLSRRAGDRSFRLGQLGMNSYEEMMMSTTLLDALEAGVAECGCADHCAAHQKRSAIHFVAIHVRSLTI